MQGGQPGHFLHLRTYLPPWGCAHLARTRAIVAPLRPYFWEPFPTEFLIVILELCELCISLDSISAFCNEQRIPGLEFRSHTHGHSLQLTDTLDTVDDSSASEFMNHVKISNFIRASSPFRVQYNLYSVNAQSPKSSH